MDYYNRFPVLKKTGYLSADSMIRAVMIVFSEFGLPKKIVSNAVTNSISDKLRQFSRQLNIEQAISS